MLNKRTSLHESTTVYEQCCYKSGLFWTHVQPTTRGYIYIYLYTYREREGLQKHSKGRLLREKAVNKRMYIDILCYIHAFADTGAHSPKEALWASAFPIGARFQRLHAKKLETSWAKKTWVSAAKSKRIFGKPRCPMLLVINKKLLVAMGCWHDGHPPSWVQDGHLASSPSRRAEGRPALAKPCWKNSAKQRPQSSVAEKLFVCAVWSVWSIQPPTSNSSCWRSVREHSGCRSGLMPVRFLEVDRCT